MKQVETILVTPRCSEKHCLTVITTREASQVHSTIRLCSRGAGKISPFQLTIALIEYDLILKTIAPAICRGMSDYHEGFMNDEELHTTCKSVIRRDRDAPRKPV